MNRRRWQAVTGFLLTVGIVAGVVWTVRGQDWSGSRAMLTSQTVPYLLTAAVMNVVALLFAMLSWRCLVAELGHPLPVVAAARVYFAGVSAKYLPGRVWVVLTQARLAGALGVSGSATVAAFLLNVVVMMLTGLLVGLLTAPETLGRWGWWLLTPAPILIALLVRPGLVGRIAGAGARLVRRELTLTGNGAGFRKAICWAVGSWVVAGLHLWLLAVSTGAPAGRSLPVTVGGFALATVLSALVVVVPDGVFVRELLVAVVLLPVMPFTAAAAVAVASRVVCLVTELFTVAAVLAGAELIRRHTNRHAVSQKQA